MAPSHIGPGGADQIEPQGINELGADLTGRRHGLQCGDLASCKLVSGSNWQPLPNFTEREILALPKNGHGIGAEASSFYNFHVTEILVILERTPERRGVERFSWRR